jgi:hypothetical protein
LISATISLPDQGKGDSKPNAPMALLPLIALSRQIFGRRRQE